MGEPSALEERLKPWGPSMFHEIFWLVNKGTFQNAGTSFNTNGANDRIIPKREFFGNFGWIPLLIHHLR